MAMVSWNLGAYQKTPAVHVTCRKKERDRDHSYPYKVIEITPPPKSLGIRCFPTNLQCGESVTIEGQAYTISAVTYRYQLRKGKETAAVGTRSKNTQPPGAPPSAPQFPIKPLMAGGGPRQRGAPAPPVGEKRRWVLGWAPGGEKDGFVLQKIGG
ncbi:hypothetical protein OIU85_002052 [Salix viminalis]|uniref:Uncharacterized protein n=1 Tax=Salix viminalis TaxID=40686 RepID=A0A9Q0VMK2_SALVM|nr:hypothetical protein OIU85_002052 [Salix viminalis]